jgi:hypothetical protein
MLDRVIHIIFPVEVLPLLLPLSASLLAAACFALLLVRGSRLR